MESEIRIIQYLRDRGFNAMEPIPMKDGKLSAFIKTKWGNYTISSFKAVPGDAIEDCNLGFDVIHAYGGSLAKMHNLLEECPLKETRKDYKALMNEVLGNLKTYGSTGAVMNEFYEVSDILGALPISDRNYGLVHYDFEVDNVFYDEKYNSISVIDFDDCICCWFVLDVVRAIDSLREAVMKRWLMLIQRPFWMDIWKSEVFQKMTMK